MCVVYGANKTEEAIASIVRHVIGQAERSGERERGFFTPISSGRFFPLQIALEFGKSNAISLCCNVLPACTVHFSISSNKHSLSLAIFPISGLFFSSDFFLHVLIGRLWHMSFEFFLPALFSGCKLL